MDVRPPVACAPPSCFATFCLLGYNLCKSVKVLPSSGKLRLSVAELHSFMLLRNCRGEQSVYSICVCLARDSGN